LTAASVIVTNVAHHLRNREETLTFNAMRVVCYGTSGYDKCYTTSTWPFNGSHPLLIQDWSRIGWWGPLKGQTD